MAEAYRDISLGLSEIVMHFLCATLLPFEDRGIDFYITHHEALQYQSQGSDYALPCTHISRMNMFVFRITFCVQLLHIYYDIVPLQRRHCDISYQYQCFKV